MDEQSTITVFNRSDQPGLQLINNNYIYKEKHKYVNPTILLTRNPYSKFPNSNNPEKKLGASRGLPDYRITGPQRHE